MLASLYRQSHWAIATHHCRGSYSLPDREGVEKILGQDVLLAVPDWTLLSDEVRPLVRSLNNRNRVPVGFGQKGSRNQAEIYSKMWRRNIQPEPVNEIAWVSRSFDGDGSSGNRWFGGRNAAILTPAP